MNRLLVISDETDPYLNQAIEYILLTKYNRQEQILFLWRNAPTVVIGRNQNPWFEVNMQAAQAESVSLLRRYSGGGTVFHDLGNLNFSFIETQNMSFIRAHYDFIEAVLSKWDLKIHVSDRYDVFCNDKKISGSAFYLYKKKKLHHGTLLINSDMGRLWEMLKFENGLEQTQAIRSIKSPVLNISELNEDITYKSVVKAFADRFIMHSENECVLERSENVYKEHLSEIRQLIKKYKSWDWTYGETPKFKVFYGVGHQKTRKMEIRNGYVVKMDDETSYRNMEIGCKYYKGIEQRLEGGNNMYLEEYDPLKDDMIQIMDRDGQIIHPERMPAISVEKMLKMYKTMVMSRVSDIKTLQFQRQGRILTYAPNLGQEATQVGSIAATANTDWVATAFRELGVWLYRGAPLYNLLLYWLGNENGMHMPESLRVLPVAIPIASQFQHATGLAYATVYKGERDIVIGYVGDGGTSQGDFHEALNFAAVMNTPNVFIVQNNQFAISTRRAIQTKAKTIAQKALAYGMPGIQVDGNDIFAMYAVTQYAVERARNGEGPTLIEAYTYRMGAHTTADDPTIYRDESEVEQWKKKDPIDRFKKYLLNQGLWDESKDEALYKDCEEEIKSTFEKVENSGLVSLEDVFDYTYAKRTALLEEEYEAIKNRQKEVL